MIIHFISVESCLQYNARNNYYYIDMEPEEEEISLTLKKDSGQEWGFEFAVDQVM